MTIPVGNLDSTPDYRKAFNFIELQYGFGPISIYFDTDLFILVLGL